MPQMDGMGREVGGGFRMGNTCTPVADVGVRTTAPEENTGSGSCKPLVTTFLSTKDA